MRKTTSPTRTPSVDKRKYLSQTEVPSHTLEQAARVPRAIVDQHAGRPTRPLDVAHAMKMQPASGPFRTLCGAAIAYGLTTGGPNADQIHLEELGKRVATSIGDDPEGLAARREASLRPRVLREFLQKYDGAKFPREDVAMKVLESLGVPADSLEKVFRLVLDVAVTAKLVREINGVQYVDLNHTPVPQGPEEQDQKQDAHLLAKSVASSEAPPPSSVAHPLSVPITEAYPPQSPPADIRERRVFVTHGRNRDLIPVARLLSTSMRTRSS
jgi:hypothetical protein